MKIQSKALLAITMLMVIFTQANAQDQKRDRPARPDFSSIDKNGDGDINMDEFSQQKLPRGDHQSIFSDIDSDNNGVISEKEFKSHRPPAKQKR